MPTDNIRKGFTIVELAIVLVLIGIILGMGVKGRALVETAKFKAEVNKLRKLEAATHIWMSIHPDFVLGRGSSIDLQSFYDRGILSPGEVESEFMNSVSVRYGLPSYIPIECDTRPDGLYRVTDVYTRDNSFCAALLNPLPASETGMSFVAMPLHVQCGIEVMLDDENISTGTGRRASILSSNTGRIDIDAGEFTEEEFADCMSLKSAHPNPNLNATFAYKQYFYRVY